MRRQTLLMVSVKQSGDWVQDLRFRFCSSALCGSHACAQVVAVEACKGAAPFLATLKPGELPHRLAPLLLGEAAPRGQEPGPYWSPLHLCNQFSGTARVGILGISLPLFRPYEHALLADLLVPRTLEDRTECVRARRGTGAPRRRVRRGAATR